MWKRPTVFSSVYEFSRSFFSLHKRFVFLFFFQGNLYLTFWVQYGTIACFREMYPKGRPLRQAELLIRRPSLGNGEINFYISFTWKKLFSFVVPWRNCLYCPPRLQSFGREHGPPVVASDGRTHCRCVSQQVAQTCGSSCWHGCCFACGGQQCRRQRSTQSVPVYQPRLVWF